MKPVFLVVPGLFDAATAQQMIQHYMTRRAEGPKSGDSGGTTDHPEDPNHQYPRMINMHNWDGLTGEWAMQATMLELVEQLIDDKPVLRQTMLYFKPPGGRGQALHQDEQYITIDPLIGVWIALDKSDRSVGQMVVVPGSHKRGRSTGRGCGYCDFVYCCTVSDARGVLRSFMLILEPGGCPVLRW